MPGPVLTAVEKYTQAMHIISVLLLLSAHLHSDLLLHIFPILFFDQLRVMILEKIPLLISVLPDVCYPKERRKGKKITEAIGFSNCFWRQKTRQL